MRIFHFDLAKIKSGLTVTSSKLHSSKNSSPEAGSSGTAGTEGQTQSDSDENGEQQEEHVDPLDKVLVNVGEFGLYQKLLFLALFPFGCFLAYVNFVQMFITATPQRHWCRVPELQNLTDVELRRKLSVPGAAEGKAWDKCHTFKVDWKQVLETLKTPDPNAQKVKCQHGWEFELGDIPYETVVSERYWVCKRARRVPIAQAVFFGGSFTGGLIFGWMADRFGRVPALVGSNMIACVGGIATIFTHGFWDFIFCRFLVGMAFDIQFMLMYILVLEYVGPSQRIYVAMAGTALYFGIGCMMLPWLALWMADWRKLLWLTSLPMALVIIVPFFVPESARWLLTKGHVEQAVKIMHKFEKVNRTKIPEDVLAEFIRLSTEGEKTEDNFGTLLRSVPVRNTMLIMIFVFMSCTCVFDGLVRMSENLGMDFFVTFTLTSFMELPAGLVTLLLLDRWGRRPLSCGPLYISGALSLIAMFVPRGVPVTTIAIIMRFFISMTMNAIFLWGTELLPTGVRALGSSILHMSGFVSTAMSPFIVFSERIWLLLPLLILGVLCLLSATAALVVPETMGRELPQTMADGEMIVINYSLCRYKKARKRRAAPK